MQANFWHELWDKNEIGFHEAEVNPMLSNHIQQLNLQPNDRVFIPLCGKTLDIAWLLSQGYRVVGAELSEVAIEQLFDELEVTPTIQTLATMKHYSAPGLDIYVGDIFDLTAKMLGEVQAIYDRGALVALPADIRLRYARHLQDLTDQASQLVVCYQYDQSLMAGPPFSISDEEIESHYGAHYTIQRLEDRPITRDIRGFTDANEQLWLLTPTP